MIINLPVVLDCRFNSCAKFIEWPCAAEPGIMQKRTESMLGMRKLEDNRQ